ncbi:Flavin-linked sulfhydryl oxidase of the mitochondrial IMS [Binucleata daphniae]
MRKESICVKLLVLLCVLWVSLICIRKLSRKRKSNLQYTRLTNTEDVSVHNNIDINNKSVYPLENVYSKPMTKLEIRENLGRSTWTLLHTLASVYPGIPSEEHKKDVLRFIYLLSKLYPCGDCAQHFQKLLSNYPPKIGNHDEFVMWLCKAHNVVNKRLGKQEFDCTRVEERWECGCDGA